MSKLKGFLCLCGGSTQEKVTQGVIPNMKTKSFIFFALSLALVAVFAMLPDVAMASSGGVGDTLLTDITDLFTGNLGTIIGLGISLFGLWMWLVQQSSWGLIILIAGAALTAFPGIYGSISKGFQNAFDETDTSVREGQGSQ